MTKSTGVGSSHKGQVMVAHRHYGMSVRTIKYHQRLAKRHQLARGIVEAQRYLSQGVRWAVNNPYVNNRGFAYYIIQLATITDSETVRYTLTGKGNR